MGKCVNGIIGTEGMADLEPVTPNPKASDMTLRDHFAALAMQAYINTDTIMRHDDEDIARMAYAAADAMLKERSK